MPEIQMPKLSDTMTDATLVSWKKKKGDKVAAGDVIAEIETEKATMEWESPEDGTLAEIYVEEGGKVNVGDKIAFIGGEGEEAPVEEKKEKPAEARAEKKEEKKAEPKAEEKKKKEAEKPAPAKAKEAAPAAQIDKGEEARVKASPVARRIAAELGDDLRSAKGTGPAGRVTETDVRGAAQSKGSGPHKAAPSMRT